MTGDPLPNRTAAVHVLRRLGLALVVAVVLGACGSESAVESGTETASAAASGPPSVSSIDTPAPAFTVDQSLSFARPVQPFSGSVIAMHVNDQVQVIDESTAEVLGSYPNDAQPWQLRTSYQHGALYITSETNDQLLQVTRIDAGGSETVQLDRRGFVEHAHGAPIATVVIRTDDDAELVRFHTDGQIERRIFDTGIFIEVVGDGLVLSDNNYSGDLWTVDQELNVITALNVGEVINRPGLIDSDTAVFSTSVGRYEIDLASQEITAIQDGPFEAADWLRSEFGDGWRVEASGDLVEFIDPDGGVVNELATEPLQRVSTFMHPTDNIVLVALRTCQNVLGNACEPVLGDESGASDHVSDETSDDVVDEPYVPPGFLNIVQFDIDDASISELGFVRTTSIAALALDTGWLVTTVDGSTATISTMSRTGELDILDERAIAADYTQTLVQPLGTQSLGFANYETSAIAVLTDDGLVMIDGQPLTNESAWRGYEARFAHID